MLAGGQILLQPMRSHLVFAAVAWGSAAIARPLVAQDTLRVLRAAPTDSATPASVVTVTFDRPVAGTFDKTLSPDRVLRFSPELGGVAVWRDPVTLRFTPKASLAPSARYRVTVDTIVHGLDGSRLAAPFTFEFRVNGPRLLARSFDRPYGADTLAPNGGIRLLYSAPIDLARFESELRIELSGCPGADTNPGWQSLIYGGWDDGHWGPWEHKELHDDRVSYFARMLWTGSYTASYVARATIAGSFVAPPAYAEEMYNLALQGRTAGGRFVVDGRP
jgi:hypothetical protein